MVLLPCDGSGTDETQQWTFGKGANTISSVISVAAATGRQQRYADQC